MSRRDQVTAALPDVLDRVAGGLRAGGGALSALADAAAAADLPPLLAVDLGRVIERAGEWGLGPALEGWVAGCPRPAVAAAAGALEVSALSAQARLSAIVVGTSPVVSLTLSLLADRRVAPTLIGTASGRSCLLTGVVLEGLAALWMHRIVRCDP
jgi:tight adherence protein B